MLGKGLSARLLLKAKKISTFQMFAGFCRTHITAALSAYHTPTNMRGI